MLITDDEKYAEKFGEETWGAMKGGEQKMKDKHDEEEKAKRDEEEKKRKEGEMWFDFLCLSMEIKFDLSYGSL